MGVNERIIAQFQGMKGRGIMEMEEIWKRFQRHMGYTDEAMKIFRSDPAKGKMVNQTLEVERVLLARCIEQAAANGEKDI